MSKRKLTNVSCQLSAGSFGRKSWLAILACCIGVTPLDAQRGRAALAPREVTLYAELIRMADARSLDTALVDRALATQSGAVRALAARVVGQVGRAKAGPRVLALRTLLGDADSVVAANAAYALGLLRDSASVAVLAQSVAEGGAPARDAAWALGQLGAAAREQIVLGLGANHADPGVRIQLLLAASKLNPVPVVQVIRYFSDRDPSVVWAAVYSISRSRASAGVRPLIALADAPVARDRTPNFFLAFFRRAPDAIPYRDAVSAPLRIRSEIARALARSAAGDSLAESAIRVLERLSGDPYPHVRINALRSLGSYGERARTHVIAGSRDRDANVRIAAVQSLALVRDSTMIAWQSLWAADTAHMYRRSLIESAFRFGVELAGVAEWMSATDWRRRAVVASAVAGSTNVSQIMRIAEPLAADPDPRVRVSALGALAGDTTRINDRVRELLTTASSDTSSYVRLRAAALMRRSQDDDIDPAAPVRDLAWYEEIVRTIVEPTLRGRPPRVVIRTERGDITMEFFGADAPLTVKNFLDLAANGTYVNGRFHRVVPNFVVQDGDPRGDGSGGPGYSIRDELNRRRYERGVLGMALSGPDTGGSQWFITHSPQPHLDGGYTVFGRVLAGLLALDAIVQGDLILAVR